jgi:CTP:molybdopterin cytidylyltransferase MocA
MTRRPERRVLEHVKNRPQAVMLPATDDADCEVPVMLSRKVVAWLHRLAEDRGTSWRRLLREAAEDGVMLQAGKVLDAAAQRQQQQQRQARSRA